jgi:hypothetical protein
MNKTVMVGVPKGRVGSVEQVAQRFSRWRANRVRGEHIPADLWAAAVILSEEHGVGRIAHDLRVDPDGLKKRAKHNNTSRVGSDKVDAEFVEMFVAPPSAATGSHECVVELENVRGAKMRIALNGKGVAGLSDLCGAFWGTT